MAIDKEKIISGALKFIQKGQLDKALKEYQKILEVDANDVRVLLRIAELHARRGDSKSAVDTYMKVAEQYTTQGFFLKAVAVYKNILKIDEARLEAYEKLAELYMQLGLTNDAMVQYGVLCDIHEKGGRAREMLDTLRKMLDLDPNDILSRVKLGEMYAREGHNEEASAELLTAVQSLKSLGRLDEYVKVAERYFSITQSDISMGLELASIYLERREPKSALQKLQVCYKAEPKNPRVLELLADSFGQLEMPQNQVPAYKELLKVYQEIGRAADATTIQGRIRQLMPEAVFDDQPAPSTGEVNFPKSGEFAQPSSGARPAAPHVKDDAPAPRPAPASAVPVAPATPSAAAAPRPAPAPGEAAKPAPAAKGADAITRLLTETDVYLKYGLKPRALEHLNQILQLDPDNVEARQKMRFIHEQSGDLENAAAEMFAIANILLKRNQIDDAKAMLLEVISIRPGHLKAAQLLDALAGSGEMPIEEIATLEEVVEEPSGGPHEAPAVIALAPPPETEDDFDIDVAEPRHHDSFVGAPTPDDLPVQVELEPHGMVVEEPVADDAPAHLPADEAPATATAPAAPHEEAAGDLDEDLEEGHFFLEQGLFDEARETCQKILDYAPDSAGARDLLNKIDMKEKGLHAVTAAHDRVEELSDVIEEVSGGGDRADGQIALQEILSEFKKGISETIDPRDAKSHFDLGCAYREMGLFDDAIGEFKMAMADEKMELTALHMVAVCHIAKGEHDRGVSALKKALYYDEITPDQTLDFWYEIGLAYEHMDDPGEALYYLRKVAKRDPNYRALPDHLLRLESKSTTPRARSGGSEPPHKADAHVLETRAVDSINPADAAASPGKQGDKPDDKPPAPGAPRKKISYL